MIISRPMTWFFYSGLAASLAATFGLVWLWWSERRRGVSVLLYHRVRTPEAYGELRGAERNFSVRTDLLRAQIAWLHASGYEFLTTDELAEVIAGKRGAPARGVCITFDDGSESVLTHGRPVLDEWGLTAAVFVTADPAAWVFEDQARLSDDQIKGLHEAGYAIGSHGVSHHGLDQMPPAELQHELEASREILAAVVEAPVVDIAIPLNFYDDGVLAACRAAGYRLVFTATPGRTREHSNPHEVRRIAVEGQMTLDEFKRNLSTRSLVQRRVISFLKRVPPTVLGEERWMPLRKRLFDSRLGPWLTFRYLRVAFVIGALAWICLLAAVGSQMV